MFFHFQKQVIVLFKDWNVSSVGGLVGSCAAMFVLAVWYEGLKSWRGHLARKNTAERSIRDIFSCFHVSQTLMNVPQIFMGYIFMLVVMTYNAWLGLAVVLGLGLGYFILGGIFGTTSIQQIHPESHKRASLKMLQMRPLEEAGDSRGKRNAGQETRDLETTTEDQTLKVRFGEENPDKEIPGAHNPAFEADTAAVAE